MTQYGYEPLSPEDSGSTLLERLNGVVPALLTNHKGAARPGYVQPGMMWIDDSGALWLLNLFDGANDVPIATVNPVTHTLVAAYVPVTRKLKVGAGLKLDGIAGSAEAPAEGDLEADRTLALNLAAAGLDPAHWTAGVDTTEAPISPAKLKASAIALSGGLASMQSVTNVTGSRAFGTVYQNGPKTRMFSVNASGNGSYTIGFGPTNSILGVKGTTLNGSFNLHLLVPSWWYYGVTASSGISSYAWWEAE